jgi:hypothetical protein
MDDLANITPEDVSEFERDQLRFFLGGTDMAHTLAELNPSLAWLPILADMDLLQNDAALPLWVEQNFDSLEAIREVGKNLRFFKVESANLLHHRLAARRESLSPLQAKCWQLIIRHIRNAPRATWQNEWYEILPRLKKGDVSADVLAQLTNVLTPKLFVESRWDPFDDSERKMERPTDVLAIKYRVGENVSDVDLIEAWPKTASPAIEMQFLRTLAGSLSMVLTDAVDMEVEGSVGFGISDAEVPSVAAHGQNQYHAGLLPIVRVSAEIWSMLAKRDVRAAREIVDDWQKSEHRLLRRLALYAAADPKISAQQAALILIQLPQGDLFLTNAQVEVHRLLRKRWGEFTARHRKVIEARIIAGPPVDWFREKANLGDVMDHHRFELLLDLERSKVPLGKAAARLLTQIRKRHPKWRDTEPERAGFTIWHGPIQSAVGDGVKLESIPSDRLIETAKKLAKKDFFDGDSWQGLCQNNPAAAFHGIQQAAAADKWHEWAWRPLLWSANKITDAHELNRIAMLLAQWPKEATFAETASGAAFWLDQVSEKLDARALWAAWDFIERRSPRRTEQPGNDIFTTALNDPAGNLASVLLKRTPRPRGRIELGKALRGRYERLIRTGDISGLLARVRLSAAIAFVFHQAPKWSTAKLLPSYDWSSPNALAMWSARKYSSHIGTPELFRRLKNPFLELFVRPEVPEEDLRVFSDWLAAILLANQGGRVGYPLKATEVRSLLRRAGANSLSSFAHRLATQMESAKGEEKIKAWTEIVGPVFRGAWPLDVELQTSSATFKLVQILLATGPAFGEAASVIIPFIQAEGSRNHASIFSISQTSEELYHQAPDKMLSLLNAVAGDSADQSIFGLNVALDKLRKAAPRLAQTKAFQKLISQATPT